LSSGEVPTYFSFYFLLHNSLICHNFPGSQYLQWWLPGRLRVDSGSASGGLRVGSRGRLWVGSGCSGSVPVGLLVGSGRVPAGFRVGSGPAPDVGYGWTQGGFRVGSGWYPGDFRVGSRWAPGRVRVLRVGSGWVWVSSGWLPDDVNGNTVLIIIFCVFLLLNLFPFKIKLVHWQFVFSFLKQDGRKVSCARKI
jgi:hypothetical protein